MYDGYLSLGGTEIINAQRTAAYVEKNAPSIPLRECTECDTLREAIQDPVWESPIVDDAPWFDPNTPASGRFYGLYPLELQGFEDSTRSAPVVESVGDGGSIGQVRHGTRTMRVRGMLVAADEEAASYGMTWLRAALDPPPCTSHGGSCGGAQLCYYSACPVVGDCYDPNFTLGEMVPIENEITESSPVIFRSTRTEIMWKGRLLLDRVEGGILEWGAVNRTYLSQFDERHGPIVMKRTNYVKVPNYFTSAPYGLFWGLSGGGNLFALYGTGGDPDYLEFEGGTVGTPVTLTSAGMTLPNVPTIASFDLRARNSTIPNVKVQVLEGDGLSVIAESEFIITQDWRRYSLPVPIGGATRIRFVVSEGFLDLRQIMYEVGRTPLPYFDGDVPMEKAMANYITGEIEDEYVIEWTGQPKFSASTSVWQGDFHIGVPMSENWEEYTSGICDAFAWMNVLQGTMNGYFQYDARPRIPNYVQSQPFERNLHEVVVTEGPLVISKYTLNSGAVIREVDFVMVAGRPFPYGPTEILLDGKRMIDLDTVEWIDINCEEPDPAPIIDPDCPPVPAPPRPPSVPNLCVTPESVWQRYWLTIPSTYVPAWTASSPTITISSGSSAIRQVRVRAYPNPFKRDVTEGGLLRQNLATNPKLKVDAAGWAMLGTGTSTGRQTGVGPIPTIDAWFRVTATAGSAVDAFGARYIMSLTDIAPGEWFQASFFVRMSVLHTGTIRVSWLNGSNIAVGDPIYPFTDGDIFTANTWVEVPVVLRRPTDPTIQNMSFGIIGSGGVAWVAGQTIDVTGFMFTPTTATHIYTDNFESAASLANWNLTTGVGTLQITGGAGIGGTSALQITRTPASNSWMAITYIGGATTAPNARVTSEAFIRTTGGSGAIRSSRILDGSYSQGQPYPATLAGGPYVQLIASNRKSFVMAVSTKIESGNAASEVFNTFVDSVSVYSWFPLAYFDGDSTPSLPGEYVAWSGVAGQSASVSFTVAIDPCSYCAEFIVSYLPANTTLTVDAMLERAFANVNGSGNVPANHLLYAGDGSPMIWPELTCGTEYLLAIDVPEPLLDDVTVSVDITMKE